MDLASDSIDAIRDAFLDLLKGGMTPLEALTKVGVSKFNAALAAELDGGRVRYNHKTFGMESLDGKPILLALAGRADRELRNLRDMDQAIELWLAGWTSETPNKTQTDVMSWYWRRPPRRPGKPGRFYWSTNQAFMALKCEPKA